MHYSLLLASGNDSVVVKYLEDMSDPLHPFGSDPVFIPGTSLYKPTFLGREAEFYNMTHGSSDVNINNSPYGFFPRKIDGKGDGFPIVIPTPIDMFRSLTLVTALDEGNFLDTKTETLEVEMATYNSKLQVLSFSTGKFTWTPQGTVSFFASPIRTIPAFTPNFVDLLLLLVFLPLLYALYEISGLRDRTPAALASLIPTARAGAAILLGKLKKSGKGKNISKILSFFDDSDDEDGPLQPGKPPRYRPPIKGSCKLKEPENFDESRPVSPRPWPVSFNGAVLDTVILCLMLAALVAYAAAMAMQTRVVAATSFSIYESEGTTPARHFLPFKQDSAAANATGVDVELGGGEAEGDSDPYSWELADDDNGMRDMSSMMALLSSASSAMSLSGALHGIALLTSVIRMLYSLSFNPRFGIITETMVRSFPELIELLFLTAILLVMLAVLATLNMGELLEDVSSASSSLYFMFKFLLTGDLGDMHAIAASDDGLERNTVSTVVSYILYNLLPYLIGYTIFSFILAIIAFKYYDIKFQQGTLPSMFSEAGQAISESRKVRRTAACVQSASKRGWHSYRPKPPPPEAPSNEESEAKKV